jgi:DNA replication and repair protein RecF
MELAATRLTLTNFRSYAQAEFSLDPRTVLVGPNGAGKTNLVEALYLIAAGKSFRADRESEMIRWGETEARVAGEFSRGNRSLEVTVGLTAGPRIVQKSWAVSRRQRPAREIGREFPMVLFSADDVRLIDGAPGRRRRALDLAVAGSSAAYREASGRYTKALASRNRLLEQVASGEASSPELDFWDDSLIAAGQTVIDGRREFIDFINERLSEAYGAVTARSGLKSAAASGERLEVVYQPLSADLARDLPNRRRQDIAVGTTTLGPHRDDWSLLLGNRPLASFGSGGEYRSAVLALRLTETAWLEHRLEARPILLLDDVFSELDDDRGRALLDHLPLGQVIITTPEAGGLPKNFVAKALVTEIAQGVSRV